MATPRRCLTWIALFPLLLTAAGCATLDWPWSKDRVLQATPRNPAVQILCLWQSSTGRDPDGLPCRGFAGQIIFLSARGVAPVAVKGDVRIYVFDDQGSLEERAEPRMWDFDSGAWSMHLTNSSLGPTYSVFIPYTKAGAEQVSCTLRLRLTPEDGAVLFSETAKVILPGKKVVDTIEQATVDSSRIPGRNVWLSDSNGVMTSGNDAAKSLRKTTIPLNPKDMIRDEHNGTVQEMAFGTAESATSNADPTQARLARLERLLEQTLARQQAVAPADESEIVQAAYESMSPEVDSMPPGTSAQISARRLPFRGDRNSGSPAGDGVSERRVIRLPHETHPLSAEDVETLPPPPRRLPVDAGERAVRQQHPLRDE